MSINFSVQSNVHNYEVFIERTPDFIDALCKIPQATFVIDENVWNIYKKSLLDKIPPNETIVLPISEERKNLETAQELYDQLVERAAKRNMTLVSIGGGILQDITGFVASTIYRGVNWIFAPTTLLAQADSCIGSKTSLNYKAYKNLIGSFYPPKNIYIYPAFLATQLTPDFYSGIGEVVKLHLMGGEGDFHNLAQYFPALLRRDETALLKAIQQSLKVKLNYMTGDEFDKGKRNLLNYGHDFGHALESASKFAVPHGQAVIFGMLAANLIAQRRGLLDEHTARKIAETLLIPSLAVKPTSEALDADAIIRAMKKDKKRTGADLALIMLTNGYQFERVNDLTSGEVVQTLQTLQSQLSKA